MAKEQIVDIQTGKVTVQENDLKEVALTVNESMVQLRVIRNGILAQSDWVVIKEREEGGSVSNFADWKTYRQSLRDLPTTASPKLDSGENLTNVTWPEKPE